MRSWAGVRPANTAVAHAVVPLCRCPAHPGEDPRVALGASPRGSLALLRLARAEAALRRSDFVTPDDVKAMAVPALAHRLVLRPELWISRVVPGDIVEEILNRVPTPPAVAP